ncbi:alpha/beta fold hydrolase, partial [Caballeronia sp. M23-90]
MSTIKTKDGTEIFYKDWGSGKTVVFSHGWPLDADAWDSQMLFLVQKGFRVVAHTKAAILNVDATRNLTLRSTFDEHDQDEGRHGDLLQGLGV